jgi:hypothetical protein
VNLPARALTAFHIIAAAAMLATPFTVRAQTLTGVRLETPQAQSGKPVVILVEIDKGQNETISCGANINFGDGNTRDLRIEGATFPFRVDHVYAAPGSFAIAVEGKGLTRGLRSLGACRGSVRSTVAQIGGAGSSVAQTNPGATVAQSDTSFILINRSKMEILEFYVMSATKKQWSRDLLGSDTVAAGRQFDVRPPRDEGCIFDVKAVYADNRTDERRAQDLCELTEMAFDGATAR